jgi:hypothetical protein
LHVAYFKEWENSKSDGEPILKIGNTDDIPEVWIVKNPYFVNSCYKQVIKE